jgi:hypothetical protein
MDRGARSAADADLDVHDDQGHDDQKDGDEVHRRPFIELTGSSLGV